MGVLGEFLLISIITSAGVLIAEIPGFPFPGTVTGMVLLLVLLLTGIVKLKHIGRAADFLTGFLPLFFIPLVVNIMSEQALLSRYGIKLFIVIIPTTIITLLVTGLTAALLIRINNCRKRNGGRTDG